MARAVRMLKAFACISAGLVAGVLLYVGFVQAGVLKNPFGPVVRGDLASARGDRAGLRVLFVGNSLTYYNDMPGLVQKLAAADGGAGALFAVYYTAPGWSLRRAAGDDRLADLIEEVRWDAVVLQEHSDRASASLERRRRETLPFARDLHERIEARGARTILFMNWFASDPSDLAGQLDLPAAPAALAWAEAFRLRPDLDLLASDGRHPNRAGSYLFACVFYATLSGRDPSRSSFLAGLEARDARFLQGVAAAVVGSLTNLQRT